GEAMIEKSTKERSRDDDASRHRNTRQLETPVIDGDGHWLEPVPVFLEYLCEVGSAQAIDRMRALWQRNHAWYRSTWSERQDNRTRRSNWWGVTSKTLHKAPRLVTALVNERLQGLRVDICT